MEETHKRIVFFSRLIVPECDGSVVEFQMEFADGEFSVVLDKGTLDAVFTDESDATITTVECMFSEIDRVLPIGGRYICVSLAQNHIVKKVIQDFSNKYVTSVYLPSTSDSKKRGRHPKQRTKQRSIC